MSSRRNAIGKFRCGHGLCAGDGGRLGAELASAQISAHRASAAVDTKARYRRHLRTLVANFRCSRSRPWSGVSDRHSTAPPPFFDDYLYIAVATTDRIIHERGKELAAYYRGLKKSLCRPLGWKQVASFPLLASYPWLNSFPGAPSTTHSDCFRTDRARLGLGQGDRQGRLVDRASLHGIGRLSGRNIPRPAGRPHHHDRRYITWSGVPPPMVKYGASLHALRRVHRAWHRYVRVSLRSRICRADAAFSDDLHGSDQPTDLGRRTRSYYVCSSRGLVSQLARMVDNS